MDNKVSAPLVGIQALQDLVRALNSLQQTTAKVNTQIAATTATTATGGAQTLPANPAAFVTITIGGTPFKLALYNP